MLCPNFTIFDPRTYTWEINSWFRYPLRQVEIMCTKSDAYCWCCGTLVIVLVKVAVYENVTILSIAIVVVVFNFLSNEAVLIIDPSLILLFTCQHNKVVLLGEWSSHKIATDTEQFWYPLNVPTKSIVNISYRLYFYSKLLLKIFSESALLALDIKNTYFKYSQRTCRLWKHCSPISPVPIVLQIIA